MDRIRRDILKGGAGIAALATFPRSLLAHVGASLEPVPPIVDPDVKELALRAVDAARRAGAIYADVRLTHTRQRRLVDGPYMTTDTEQMVVGVRALVDGYWGFASGPVWAKDEMDRLGREAVHQAKANTLGRSRVVELASVPVVRDGHWVMPVELDPFEVSPFEIRDFLASLRIFINSLPMVGNFSFSVSEIEYKCWLQDKAFASSDGSFCTQRLYRSEGTVRLILAYKGNEVDADELDLLTPTGVGWELFTGQPLRDGIRQHFDNMLEEYRMPREPVVVGRYDTVCDAQTVTGLVSNTLGPATELDRALGYEANATGTSYINDPFHMLGTYVAGGPAVTLTANRTERGGGATVQWDDEGVTPNDSTPIKQGVLADFQTTRESAIWLTDQYAARGVPVRSQGYASAPSALEAPLQHLPNMRLAPGPETLDCNALIAGMTKGIAVRRMNVIDMDFQALNGYVTGRMFRVAQGKRVARLGGGAILFRSPELWKGVMTLGGTASARRFGISRHKGEPRQEHFFSVTAPPMICKQLTLINAQRKS